MLNLFHPLALFLFVLNFSGLSLPDTALKGAAEKTVVVREREEDENFIPWITERRLTWEDFLCEPQRNTDAVASTSTALGIAYQVRNNELSYQITCNFSKTRSWGLLKTPYILAHEQGHFDITELFARKLHQQLTEYKLNKKTFKQDINEIYQGVVKAKESFQYLYDGQTDHSRNKAKQQMWLERIAELLEESEPYADYP